jgi:allophanate hydrolase
MRQRYLAGDLTPTALVETLDKAIGTEDAHHVWIRRLKMEEMLAYAKKLEGRDIPSLPLYGIPFAIKDNIDLAGIPTTAACPEYAYTPSKSATVVQKLIDAGAIPVGKTNLDQFATGLVGARSPHGAGRNAFNPDYISGGSSAGSAVSVALGQVSFSLGTDTAGSGRVPAAFNNLIGHKPTCGLLSTTGVIPACRTLDCVSIFALNAADAAAVLEVAQGFDVDDPYSRPAPTSKRFMGSNFKFGVPQAHQLEFFGNPDTPALFNNAVKKLKTLGGEAVTIDFAPFLETARLLYEGPWVAERYAAIREFIETKPDGLLPVTRQIIGGATKFSAADTFAALYKLKAMQRRVAPVWDDIDMLLTPTAGTIYRVAEIEAEPVKYNSNLGYYTNYVNLLDMSAIAVPAGFQGNGLPFGVTLTAPAFSDDLLLKIASHLHSA